MDKLCQDQRPGEPNGGTFGTSAVGTVPDFSPRLNQLLTTTPAVRKLVDQRAEKDRSIPTNRSRPSSSTSSSQSITPFISKEQADAEAMEKGLRRDKEAFQDLVAEGGQPSRSITPGFDVVNHPETHEKYKDIFRVWQDYAGDPFVFCRQRIEWREFRDCQERVRRFYIPRSRFHEENDANKRIEAAEQKLQRASSEAITGKSTQVEEAEKELQVAQEISRLQTRKIFARNPELGRQQKQTRKRGMLLKWIDNQYPTIAAECGFPTSDDVKDSSRVPPSLAESKGSRKAKRRLPPRQRGLTRTQPVCGLSSSSGISKPLID
ncbi:MAG: hypothetical protein L6R35_001825 [Caloplaca aegaea]|nr:MAG: hypothetical protein L6R35_001825 [Caloplaca aegaea]